MNLQNIKIAGYNFRKKNSQLFTFALLLLFGFTACKKTTDGVATSKNDIVYIETNNTSDNQNAILAYVNKGDGTMEQIAGSPFLTSGAGVGNYDQILGPDDSDQQIIITPDKKFLLAVNSGSNTIAVFSIHQDGSLQAVTGSPFASGGNNPVSLGMSGEYVFVINKSQDPLHPSDLKPNYTTMKIDGNGKLTLVDGAKFETTAGVSPAQALISNDHKFLFGADFLGFMQTPAAGTLRSFAIGSNGALTTVAGTPQVLPVMGGALGLWQHPKANVLYVGFPVTGQIGVYTIESSGALTFLSALNAGPAACWLRTDAAGNFLYSLNSAENTISVFNASSPGAPVAVQKFTQKIPGPIYMAMEKSFTTSEPFSFELSPSGKFMYVVNQHTNKDFTIGNFNYLHVLQINTDGTLSEPLEPVQLPVENKFRPQGAVVYQR